MKVDGQKSENCLEEYNYRSGDLLHCLSWMHLSEVEATTGGGNGKRQKTSHSRGVFGPAKNAAKISDSSFRSGGSSPPETPDANSVSLKSETTDTTKEMPDCNIPLKKIAELKEIFSTPEAEEAMKPTSPSEPLYNSDDIDGEEWYWPKEGCDKYAGHDKIPRTTDESLRSNEKYYQAMIYAVDNSGMSRGLYATKEKARECRDAVRVVIKSNDPKRSKIVELPLLANVGFQKSHQDKEPLSLTASKLWSTGTPEDYHDLLCALKKNNVSFDEKNAEGVCANDALPRWVRAII